jgi:uncharacterized membrane protein YdbT with pleckstrin-like domain
MIEGAIIIPRVWRSEIVRLVLFVVLSVAALVASRMLPGSVISGTIFSLGHRQIRLSLPLFWLVPAWVIVHAMLRIYNVCYLIDQRGIESRVGILSLNQVVTRIRFEDIRSIESEQTIVERMLNIGMVAMGTSATAGLEMIFDGVDSPQALQALIQDERDRRIQIEQKREHKDKKEDQIDAPREMANA